MAKTGLTDTMWLGNKRTFVIDIGDEDDPGYDPATNLPALDITNLDLQWSLSLVGVTEDLVCKKSLNGDAEIEKVTPVSGICHVKLVGADTVDLVPGSYQFQLEVVDGSGEAVVVQEGLLTLKLNQEENC